MRKNKLMLVTLGVTYLFFSGAAFSESDVKSGKRGQADGLQALNKQIVSLSDQIVVRQQGLEDDLDSLIEKRRSLLDLEKRIGAMISEQEDKLVKQGIAIEESDKQLKLQKEAYFEQQKRLDDLRASLDPKNRSLEEQKVAESGVRRK